MARLLLIAHTPRAGRHNHRFLIPPGATLADGVLSDFLAAATGSPDLSSAAGGNYLAAVREVEQPTTGRRGQEVLMLVGVDVARLNPDKRRAVDGSLRDRMGDLEDLIVRTVDWERDWDRLLVERPELAEWLRRLPSGLPVHRTTARPLPMNPRRGGRRWVLTAVAGLAALVVAAVVGLAAGLGTSPLAPTPSGADKASSPEAGGLGPAEGKGPVPGEPPKAEQTEEELYRKLVSRWDCEFQDQGLDERKIQRELFLTAYSGASRAEKQKSPTSATPNLSLSPIC